jgi:hypothetical protein
MQPTAGADLNSFHPDERIFHASLRFNWRSRNEDKPSLFLNLHVIWHISYHRHGCATIRRRSPSFRVASW